MGVVKADAYGHGASLVAPILADAGAAAFGVATVEEGIELRAAGIRAPILVLYGIDPRTAQLARDHDLAVAVVDATDVALLASGGGEPPLRIHLEVDTGMTRLGVRPQEVSTAIDSIRAAPGLELDGLFAHLANADDAYTGFAESQVRVFADVVATVEAAGVRPRWVHLANSVATLTRPDTHRDMVRPGVALYGVAPGSAAGASLEPVMALETCVWRLWEVPAGRHVGYDQTFVTQRPTRIAVLPMGYDDGFWRALSNRGHVMIDGRLAPVIGRVCMDVVMVDVTDLPPPQRFDPVLVWGRSGASCHPVDEVARACDTIAYEVLSRVGKRVPRKLRG